MCVAVCACSCLCTFFSYWDLCTVTSPVSSVTIESAVFDSSWSADVLCAVNRIQYCDEWNNIWPKAPTRFRAVSNHNLMIHRRVAAVYGGQYDICWLDNINLSTNRCCHMVSCPFNISGSITSLWAMFQINEQCSFRQYWMFIWFLDQRNKIHFYVFNWLDLPKNRHYFLVISSMNNFPIDFPEKSLYHNIYWYCDMKLHIKDFVHDTLP